MRSNCSAPRSSPSSTPNEVPSRGIDVMRTAVDDKRSMEGFLMAHPLDPATLETQLLAPTRPGTPTSPRTKS